MLAIAVLLSGCLAFVPSPAGPTKTALHASSMDKRGQQLTAGVVAAALALGTLQPLPASAHDFGSSQIIAARSGGRAGGRAYRAPSRSSYAAPSRTTYRSSTTIVRPMIAPSPVIVSPFGYGYSSPFSGFGLGYGLGAMNSAGDSYRDYRQESEIQRSQMELEQAKQREAELETRLKALEDAQKQQVNQ